MRIAFISTMKGHSWGGSEELWFETAQAALRGNHHVLASVFKHPVISKKLETLEKHGARIYFRDWNIGYSSLLKRVFNRLKNKITFKQQKQLNKLLRFKPDIVCWSSANSYDASYHPEVLKFLEKNQLPFAVICQGHEDKPFFRDEDRLTVKRCYEKALWVGFVSLENKISAERHLAGSIPNGFVLRNPVNLNNTAAISFPSTLPKFKFATVGRLDPWHKSQDVLFEALSKDIWFERNWELTLVGAGENKVYLEELAKYYKIENRVVFLGQVDDIRQVWAEHHIMLLPSRYEGTPLALVESMICGRPAVVTEIAGNTEWIEEGINGFVAEAPSTKSLAKALERAWDMRENWKEMGKLAREKALKQYDKNSGKTVLEKLILATTKHNKKQCE